MDAGGEVTGTPRDSMMAHQRALCEQLWKLRMEGTLCDMTLQVGNEQLRAHRVVLSACSPYLRTRCALRDVVSASGNSDSGPGGAEVVEHLWVVNCSAEVCLLMLEHLYTGKSVQLSPGPMKDQFNALCHQWQLEQPSSAPVFKAGNQEVQTDAVSASLPLHNDDDSGNDDPDHPGETRDVQHSKASDVSNRKGKSTLPPRDVSPSDVASLWSSDEGVKIGEVLPKSDIMVSCEGGEDEVGTLSGEDTGTVEGSREAVDIGVVPDKLRSVPAVKQATKRRLRRGLSAQQWKADKRHSSSVNHKNSQPVEKRTCLGVNSKRRTSRYQSDRQGQSCSEDGQTAIKAAGSLTRCEDDGVEVEELEDGFETDSSEQEAEAVEDQEEVDEGGEESDAPGQELIASSATRRACQTGQRKVTRSRQSCQAGLVEKAVRETELTGEGLARQRGRRRPRKNGDAGRSSALLLKGGRPDRAVKKVTGRRARCRPCQKDFPTKVELSRHRRDHHRQRDCQKEQAWCQRCEIQFPERNQLLAHSVQRHWEEGMELPEIYSCDFPTCGFNTYKRMSWYNHRLHAHPSECSVCDECGKTLKNELTLRQHKAVVHATGPRRVFSCPECEKVFLTESGMHKHKELVHRASRTEREKFVCPYCAHTCLLAESLTEHLYKKHDILPASKKAYQCPHCDFKTTHIAEIKKHEIRHKPDKEKPFRCDKCEKRFVDRGSLMSHKLKHDPSASLHKCSYCDYSTKYTHNLRAHIQVRHEKKDYKPWGCDECSYRCNSKGNLYKHLRNVHKRTVETKYTVARVSQPTTAETLEDGATQEQENGRLKTLDTPPGAPAVSAGGNEGGGREVQAGETSGVTEGQEKTESTAPWPRPASAEVEARPVNTSEAGLWSLRCDHGDTPCELPSLQTIHKPPAVVIGGPSPATVAPPAPLPAPAPPPLAAGASVVTNYEFVPTLQPMAVHGHQQHQQQQHHQQLQQQHQEQHPHAPPSSLTNHPIHLSQGVDMNSLLYPYQGF